jgi:hypothetical protein
MTVGAIIGANVAGSSQWTRRQSRRRAEPKPVEVPATTESVAVSDEAPAR